MLRTSPIEAYSRAHFEHPVVLWKTVLGTIAVVSEPQAIRHVLIENAANYRRDRIQQRIVALPFGTSILEAEGEQWKAQRRCIASALSPKAVAGTTGAIAAAATSTVVKWWSPGAPAQVDILHEMDLAMVDAVERAFFPEGLGQDPNEVLAQATLYNELIANVGVVDIFDLPEWLRRLARMRRRRVLAFFAEMAANLVQARQARLADPSYVPPNDLLTAMLQSHERGAVPTLSRREVAANLATLFVAAYETSAAGLAFALYLLSIDREWRDRVETEVDRELPDGCLEGPLDRLKVTRAVIEETLRLYPPLPTINRQAIAADRLGPYAIAPDTFVVVSPWVLHRHKLLWEFANLFDPSRFLSPARETINRFAYLPFGAGPRTCVGETFAWQAMIVMLATIIRSFRLEVATDYRMRPVHRIRLCPKGGLPMILHRRERRPRCTAGARFGAQPG